MGDDKKPATTFGVLRAMKMTLLASAASAAVSSVFVTDTGRWLGGTAYRELSSLVYSGPLRSDPPAMAGVGAAKVPERNLQAVYRWQAGDYMAGDQAPELGRFNMIVQTPDGLGLTSSAAAPMEAVFAFAPIQRDSTVDTELSLPTWSGQRITLLAGDSELIAVVFSGRDVVFGDLRENYRSAGCSGTRDAVTVTVSAAKARLWCNGVFVGLQEVRNLPLSAVRVSGLVRKRDHLYSVVASLGPR